MSLPKAHSGVSSNPGSTTVTNATDRQTQEKSVEQKLKLYGIIQAFQKGNMPTNKQIDEALTYADTHSPVDLKKLSPDGRRLVEDVRDIIETARLMIMTKNQDQTLQSFIWHTQQTDTSRGAQGSEVLPTSKGEVQRDAENASVHLRTLLTLIFTNSEARKLIGDLGIVGRDLFSTAAIKVAEKARPDEEQLNNVDKEAPSKEWVGPNGEKYGTNETPKIGVNLPGGHQITHDPKAPVAQGTIHRDADGNETTAGEGLQKAREVRDQAQSQKEDLKSQGLSAGKEALERGKQAHQQGGTEGLKQEAQNMKGEAKGKANEAQRQTENDGDAQNLKSRFSNMKDKIMSNTKEQANDKADRTKDFLDEQFPEERREQFIYRMKKVVVECQSHNDYDEAINFFLNLLETYKGHSKQLAGAGADSVQSVTADPNFTASYEEMKTLLERFANGKSLNGVIDAVDALYVDAQNDKQLNNWFSKLDRYIRKSLLEPGWILEDECTREGNKLTEEGKSFFDEKYKGHKDDLFDEVTAFFRAFADDPVNKRFGEDWKRLTKDILFDKDGNLEFKPHLWNDIRKEILPQIINQVGYIPIPRIEYTDKAIDLIIENLVLQGANIMPNVVELEANNFFRFSPYKGIADKSYHKFRLHFSQIQADMKEVGWYVKKKTGFPKIKDSGLADVLLAGNGISVDVTLESAGSRKDSVFLIKDVTAKVDTLKFSVRDSKHDTLYKIMAPLATGLIKKAIAGAIEKSIRTGLEYVDDQLVEVRSRMDEAKRDDNDLTRGEALKALFEKKKAEGEQKKAKADQINANGDFAIVTSPDKELLPNAETSKSWTESAFAKERKAGRGTGWQSEAFSIV